jgi:hypothetical protein
VKRRGDHWKELRFLDMLFLNESTVETSQNCGGGSLPWMTHPSTSKKWLTLNAIADEETIRRRENNSPLV